MDMALYKSSIIIINPDQAVDGYDSLCTLFTIRCFSFRTFTPRQFPFEKIVYLQKASANPSSQDVKEKPSSGEMAPVFHWSKNAIPSVNGQAPVVQRVDSVIHRINRYQVHKCPENKLRYPLDSDLSGG